MGACLDSKEGLGEGGELHVTPYTLPDPGYIKAKAL